MGHLKNLGFLTVALPLLCSCDYLAQVESKAKTINNYEAVALHLTRENKQLEVEISRLKFELENTKTENAYMKTQMEKAQAKASGQAMVGRGIASVAPVMAHPNLSKPKKDMVEFGVYKWGAVELVSMAQNEFKAKNFEKAAQYYMAFSNHYAGHELYNDDFLFQAGIAAYEAGNYNDWAKKYFSELVERYPASPHYRGAKLWEALTNLREGDTKKFFGTVEEFRLKYRNTPEWKTLSAKYEEIVRRYKN
jgi:TolA-binding protein